MKDLLHSLLSHVFVSYLPRVSAPVTPMRDDGVQMRLAECVVALARRLEGHFEVHHGLRGNGC